MLILHVLVMSSKGFASSITKSALLPLATVQPANGANRKSLGFQFIAHPKSIRCAPYDRNRRLSKGSIVQIGVSAADQNTDTFGWREMIGAAE